MVDLGHTSQKRKHLRKNYKGSNIMNFKLFTKIWSPVLGRKLQNKKQENKNSHILKCLQVIRCLDLSLLQDDIEVFLSKNMNRLNLPFRNKGFNNEVIITVSSRKFKGSLRNTSQTTEWEVIQWRENVKYLQGSIYESKGMRWIKN